MEKDEFKVLLKLLREINNKNYASVAKHFDIPEQIVLKAISSSKSEILSDHYPYKRKISRKVYEKKKLELQVELVKLQNWIRDTNQKVIILFEGRDAAGKGGTIKRFMEHLNPRGARVVALEKPTSIEKGQWYFQRYINHFPTNGEIVFFDRSWYNRAGVEKVMGFCTPKQFNEFNSQVTDFENMIIESGITLIKFWFSVSRAEQLRRFISRTQDPLKQWKLSPMDLASLSRWNQYKEAKELMFHHSNHVNNPWIVIRSDDKKRARLNALRHVLNIFDYDNKDHRRIIPIDNHIINEASKIYSDDEINHHEFIKTKKK